MIVIRDCSFKMRLVTKDDLCAVLDTYQQLADFLKSGLVPTASIERVLKPVAKLHLILESTLSEFQCSC